MPQPKRKLVPDHIKSAIVYYGSQAAVNRPTQKRIAELVGTSERSVYRILKEAGLLTNLPRMTVEDVKVQALMRINGIGYDKLKRIIEEPHEPTRAEILKAITEMEDGTWAALLKDIVTARVAKSHNVGVSTAMLNIQNAIDKNAKPGNN